MANRRGEMETVANFILWGSKITADGGCSHEIKRRLLLGRNAMTNLLVVVVFRHEVTFDSAIPCTAALQASTLSQSLLKVVFVKLLMLFNQPLLWPPLLLLPSTFPSIRICSMSQFFTSGGQNIGLSVSSGLPVNIQGWFPLGYAGLISLQSKGLSRVFFRTTVRKHQFFGSQPSLRSNSHIHTWLLEKP